MAVYEHVPHPHIKHRQLTGPVKVADQHPTGNAYARFNTKVALGTTGFVGSMTCAWVFAAVALVSLPAAISSGNVITIIAWIAQTFLQLVLLSVIMVGQNVQADASDARSLATFKDAEALIHEFVQLQGHLFAQDELIRELAAKLNIELSPLHTNPPQPATEVEFE